VLAPGEPPEARLLPQVQAQPAAIRHRVFPNFKQPEQKASRVEEEHLKADPLLRMISIPCKYARAQVIGLIEGKSAIHLARVYGGRKQNFVAQSFWARGYFVSTVGRDEALVRKYIPARRRTRTSAWIS